jgi:hypothetical protein
VLLAGCGSSGSDRLTRAEYARQADAICARYNREIAALGKPGRRDVAAYAARAAPIARRTVARLRALKPPKDEEAEAHRWTAANDRIAHVLVNLRDAASHGDRVAAQAAIRSGSALDEQANLYARHLGMKTCAQA